MDATNARAQSWPSPFQMNMAEIIDGCAAGKVSKEQLAEWFELHKKKFE
ncbi:MAG: hypothetical protein HYV97_02705 [Bdellovibrio sp.]|nr:hypothetical protein [Bdellovibrio sp.]